MSGSLNKVLLIGNLGTDPDIRVMSNGDKVANLSIATSEKWTDKQSGEKKERTQWHRVVIFSQGLVGIVEKYLEKGAKILVEGGLETRKWDDNGVERYSTEVVLRSYSGKLTMLSSK